MKEIIEQFINQIEEDQNFSQNTKSSYKSDLNELADYMVTTNTQISDINQDWVRNYLKHLESVNKERNSYNRRASTFRIFLRFLYKNNMAPTNYSLIVSNLTTFSKTQEEGEDLKSSDVKKIIEETKLRLDQKLILLMIGRLGLTATQIVSLNTFQIDFENKSIALSDTEKIELPYEIFINIREYLLDVRPGLPGTNEHLNLFLNDKGNPITEIDIYKLIKKLSQDLNLEGKFTTRNLKKMSEDKIDILSMQREVFSVVAPNQ
ncbi:MAG: site-specific integrase [Candidatus Melainabacteria bacterium]|nr:site-specific integrase [Candidatus Melainabacteria bacterium]